MIKRAAERAGVTGGVGALAPACPARSGAVSFRQPARNSSMRFPRSSAVTSRNTALPAGRRGQNGAASCGRPQPRRGIL